MKGRCSSVWKKKMAAALSVAFLAGSLTFGSTASAYMIDVGMADLAAKEKAENEKKAEQLKKEQKAAEQQAAKEKAAREKKAAAEREAEQKRLKEQNSKLENKQESRKNEPEIRLLQDKKEAPAEVKTTPKTNAVDEAMKAMEEAAQDSNTAALGNKKAAEPKTVATEKKAEEPKLPAQQNKATEPKTPAQQNKPEARNTVTEKKTTQEAKPVQQSKKEEPKSGESKADKKQKDAKKERFQEILRDESFVYYMDTQSARYVPIPNRQDRMIDVWVKLKPNSFSDEEDAKAGKYYLEHYYLNPKSKQIQFLCELEVTGRPSNAIKERPYSSQNWENLVPGSVEDDIYHAVVEKAKSSSSIGGVAMPSASDVLDMLNIGL